MIFAFHTRNWNLNPVQIGFAYEARGYIHYRSSAIQSWLPGYCTGWCIVFDVGFPENNKNVDLNTPVMHVEPTGFDQVRRFRVRTPHFTSEYIGYEHWVPSNPLVNDHFGNKHVVFVNV